MPLGNEDQYASLIEGANHIFPATDSKGKLISTIKDWLLRYFPVTA